MKVVKPEGQGLSADYLWRSMQPGFINVSGPSDATKAVFLAKKANPVFWDGTFNQPILPLADKMHKDACNYWTY